MHSRVTNYDNKLMVKNQIVKLPHHVAIATFWPLVKTEFRGMKKNFVDRPIIETGSFYLHFL